MDKQAFLTRHFIGNGWTNWYDATCSECGKYWEDPESFLPINYCPECGTRLTGEKRYFDGVFDEEVRYNDRIDVDCIYCVEQAKAEAIKEFAERLKAKADDKLPCENSVDEVDIDNLVREMVGDNTEKRRCGMRKILFWLVKNVPLGRLAPYVFGLAVGRMPKKKGGEG